MGKYSDVYGYGIILWEMGTRKVVYEGLESTQIIANVANEGLRPPVPEDCPWKDVMVKCWQENPRHRPKFNEVVVELNRISKDLDEQTFENAQQQEPESTAEEKTPLIEENNATASSRSNGQNDGLFSIISNNMRQRRE